MECALGSLLIVKNGAFVQVDAIGYGQRILIGYDEFAFVSFASFNRNCFCGDRLFRFDFFCVFLFWIGQWCEFASGPNDTKSLGLGIGALAPPVRYLQVQTIKRSGQSEQLFIRWIVHCNNICISNRDLVVVVDFFLAFA